MYNLEKELQRLENEWEQAHNTTVQKELKNGSHAEKKETESK